MITGNQKQYIALIEEGGKKLMDRHAADIASGASSKRREFVRRKSSRLNIVNRCKENK